MESSLRRIKTGNNDEIVVEQVESNNYTEIFVQYVGKKFANMVFVDPNKLFVYATENDYIDLDVFDKLPDPIPNRELVRKALEELPSNFNPGVMLKAVIYAEDEQSIFMDPASFTLVSGGRRARIEESFNSSEIFVNRMLPFFTYKDILKLETIKFFRLIISNYKLGVWQTLFARDFSQLYTPQILPSSTTEKADIEIRTRSNFLCKFLDNISKSTDRIGTANSKTRPYWKLLYEYHFTLPKRPKWITTDVPIPKNRTITLQNDPIPLDELKTCAMFKGSLVCLGGNTGLMSSSLSQGWTNKKYIQTTKDTLEAKQAEEALSKIINDAQTAFVARVLKFVLARDALGEVTVRESVSIIVFETRENHIFCSIRNNRKNRTLNCIFGPLQDNNTYVTDKIYDEMHMGLIGTRYCFIRRVVNPFIEEENNFETVIIDATRQIEIAVLDHTRNIYVCYNTPSDCFIESDKSSGRVEYIWKILTTSGVKNVLTANKSNIRNFDPATVFTLNEKYWIWKTNDKNRLIILRRDGRLWKLDFDDIITDICIVGDRLYVVSLPNTSITFIELWIGGKQLDGGLRNYPGIYKRCAFETSVAFDYVRTSPTGLMLCSRNPKQTPLWLLPDINKFKLLGCHICKMPSDLMCSECKTPACSDEHFRCCKE